CGTCCSKNGGARRDPERRVHLRPPRGQPPRRPTGSRRDRLHFPVVSRRGLRAGRGRGVSAPVLPGLAVPAPKTAPAVAFRFTVPGQPVSKGRPHVFTQKLKSGKTFTKAVTPERTVVYENWGRECARKARR